MSTETKARQANPFYPGRLEKKIAEAKAGDARVGLELLSMASLQLREYGELEPDLVIYLREILNAIVRNPAGDIRRCLHINRPPKPKHRPPNKVRNAHLISAFEIASDVRMLHKGNESDLLDALNDIRREKDTQQALADTNEWVKELRALQLEFETDAKGRWRTLKTPERLRLARDLFNIALRAAQARGDRTNERPATVDAIRGAVGRRARSKATP